MKKASQMTQSIYSSDLKGSWVPSTLWTSQDLQAIQKRDQAITSLLQESKGVGYMSKKNSFTGTMFAKVKMSSLMTCQLQS